MSRALRYAPPLANRGLIIRPRLLEQLLGRFERPVTAVVAAPGFGKTTLLAQAVRENALSPLGDGRWLTCQRDDASLSFLAQGAFAALGLTTPVPEDPHRAAVTVAEALLGAAPRHVALILDDAHWLEPKSPGGTFLKKLVEELPLNGHVVLASRPPLPLGTNRLVAGGEAVVLQESDLQFQRDETEAFADSRGVAPQLLSDVGGWPALAELTATVGQHAVTGYVWEELLSQLSSERRHALGVLVAVGGCDDEVARALLGDDIRLAELLEGLPLVVRSRSGWWSLHGLWASALQHHLDAGEVAEARRTAGRVLARRRQYHDAMELLLDAEAWQEVRQLVVEVCEVCTPLVAPDVLDVWLRRMPPDVQRTPEGLLLAAMVAEPTRPDVAEELLDQALDAAPDVPEVRYACLNALVQLAFWRNDRVQMKSLSRRLRELAENGHREALSWIVLLQAQLQPRAERVRAVLRSPDLALGSPLNPVQYWLHAHIVLLELGDAVRGEDLARRSLAVEAPTMRAVSRAAVVESLRLQGKLEQAEPLLADLVADLEPAKLLTSPELLTHAVVLGDVLGRHEEATQLLQRFHGVLADSPVAWAPIAAAVATAFHHVTLGDEEQASMDLKAVSHLSVVRNQAVVQVSTAAQPLLYVLLPDVRSAWDDVTPPGCFAVVGQVTRALVELRENGSAKELTDLSGEGRRLLHSVMPTPWAAELAVGLVSVGDEEGRTLLESLGSGARKTLRDLLSSPHRSQAAT